MQFMLFIHVLCAIVGFGAAFSTPMLARSVENSGEALAKVAMFIQAPALGLLLVTGAGVAGMSDGAYEMSAPWISAAFLVGLAAIGLQVLVAGAYRKGDASKAAMFTGLTHLMLVIGLFLMVWKPGV
jgi:hypothetical protein